MLALLPLALSLVSPAQSTDPLAWFTGSWCTADPAGEQTCQLWAPARGGMKIGSEQELRDGRSVAFELVAIEVAGPKVRAMVYRNGAAPIPFVETVREAKGMIFENPAHAYPQRIHYWREGDVLHEEVMLIDGSRRRARDYVLQRD